MRQSFENQNTQINPLLRIRCPHCFQVFKAFKNEFEEDYPDFQCSVCSEKFWIDSTKTDPIILGQPISVQKIQKPAFSGLGITTKVCPRCTEEVPKAEQECPHCGVVFIKVIEGVESSFQLRGMWGKVIKNWHDERIHDEFLRACHKQNELVYGISCYGRILKEDKGNKKAKDMIKRMEALTWFFEDEISLPKLTKQEVIKKIRKWMGSYSFDALMLSIAIFMLIYIFS